MTRQTRKVTKPLELARPKLDAKDYGFFSMLADAVSVFKSHDLPGANCEGCIVSPMKKNGKRLIKFMFAVASGRTMEVDINIDELQSNPREYIEHMLEIMNEAYKEAKKQFDSEIFLMSGNTLAGAVQAVNRSVTRQC